MDYLKGEKHMGMISIDENFLDFLLVKSLNDISPAELEFEQKIKGTVDQQIDETIQLLQSEEYRHSLFRSSEEKQKFLDSIKEKTEELLQAGYTDVNVIVNELYEEGRKQGLIDLGKSTGIIWGTGDQYALQHLLTYDMGLIQKLTDDTRKDIANEIFKGVLNGESIPKIAKRIKNIPNFKPLEGTKLTANQRAMLIARTETMRAKNTGLLNSYKQYNVEYVDVMPAIDACDACKDFAKLHNTIPLSEVKGFLPLHPRCRCTYAPASLNELLTLPKKDFKSVEPVPKELYETVKFDAFNNKLSNYTDKKKINIKWDKNIIKEDLPDNIPELTKEGIIKFNEELKKVYDGNEWGMIVNHTTGQISQIVTDHISNKINPLDFVDYGENDKLTVIHNHTNESTFSDVDLGKLIYEENVESCIAFTTKKLYVAETNTTDEEYAKKIYKEMNKLYCDNIIAAKRYGLSDPYGFNERLWYKIKTDSLLNENIKFKEVEL